MHTNNVPFVSIVIACRNEEAHIGKVLDSIFQQDYPGDRIEILAVDGCSDDGTRTILDKYGACYRQLKVIDNPERITPRAFNLGAMNAVGEIVMIISAHATIERDYVSRCVEYLQRTGADNVGGPMRAVGIDYISNAIAFVHCCSFGLGGGRFHNETFEGEVDTVYMGAWRKEVFARYGYFDETLIRNQDIEFNARIRNGGGKIFLTPHIRSRYYCRANLKGLAHQNFRNGFWNIKTIMRNRNSLSLRHFVPLIFVFSLLSGPLIVPRIWCCVVIAYTSCSLWFSYTIAREKGMKYFLILPVIFAALHCSYGIGSIMGLLGRAKILCGEKEYADHGKM